jgi:hypothetical protein
LLAVAGNTHPDTDNTGYCVDTILCLLVGAHGVNTN